MIDHYKDTNLIHILTKKLDIDKNLALYLQQHYNVLIVYFFNDRSVKVFKNEFGLQEPMFDQTGTILPQFACETIYIKKSDLIL